MVPCLHLMAALAFVHSVPSVPAVGAAGRRANIWVGDSTYSLLSALAQFPLACVLSKVTRQAGHPEVGENP